MELLANVTEFVVKTVVFLVAFALMIGLVVSNSKRDKSSKVKLVNLNQVTQNNQLRLFKLLLDSGLAYYKKVIKELNKVNKTEKKQRSSEISRRQQVYILKFKGDVMASGLDQLREAINAVLLIASPGDKALVCLESPGGGVSAYGLLASQLLRLRSADLTLIVCVDKIAASGGYLAACVAHKIIAAPFAIIGSIGVVTTIPNFYKFLKEKNIDVMELTAGKHKRSVSMLGKTTKDGLAHVETQLSRIHDQFKSMVLRYRPQVDVDKTCDGDYWTASEALSLQLIDDLMTSDEVISSEVKNADVFEVSLPVKTSFIEKITQSAVINLSQTLERIFYG